MSFASYLLLMINAMAISLDHALLNSSITLQQMAALSIPLTSKTKTGPPLVSEMIRSARESISISGLSCSLHSKWWHLKEGLVSRCSKGFGER